MRHLKDDRGKSWFDIAEECEGQIDITHSYPGTIRAFHLHQEKTEWKFNVQGEFKFVLTDPYEVIYTSAGQVVKVEPGRWHGYQNIGTEIGIIMEYSDKKYDLENPDDQVKPYDEFHSWEKKLG